MCVFVLRPFFGQCIFNIIFAATSPSLFRPPFSAQLLRPQFFQIFIFWLLFTMQPPPTTLPLPTPTRSNLVCNGRVCIFSTYAACRVLGVGRRPLATVRFAGGLAAYAKCSQRFCIFIFLFLCFPSPPPTARRTTFFAFKPGVEVKRTVGWAGLVISGRHCHACNNKCCKGAGSLATNTFCHISRKYF